MGSGASRPEQALVRQAPAAHKQKVDPLLRANHKHALLLKTCPPRPSTIAQVLSAACLLELEPPAALFDLWDAITGETVDVADSESEIVETDYLSPETVGDEAQATRYVDYFDDEMVRHLYHYRACLRQYLQVPEVVDGLLAREGWAAKQLASALEIDSKDMCTEGLGGALAFHRPIVYAAGPSADATAATFDTEADVVRARDEVIDCILGSKDVDLAVVGKLVLLHSLAVLWTLLPAASFAKLWRHQVAELNNLTDAQDPFTTTTTTTTDWPGLVRRVCREDPFMLPELRLLQEHPEHGGRIAARLFAAT